MAEWKWGNEKARADARAAFADGITSGVLNAGSVQTMIERLKYSPLQFQAAHVDSETAMRGWRIATPAERAQLLPIVAGKVANSKSVPIGTKQAWLEELNAWQNGHRE